MQTPGGCGKIGLGYRFTSFGLCISPLFPVANKLNPMPQLRALIVQGLERIEVDMDQCPKEWQYGIQYELKYSGYVPLEPAGNVITYIKKKKPSK